MQKYKRKCTITTTLQTKITAREYLVLFHTQLTDQTNEWMNKPNKKSTTTTNLFQIKYLRRNSMHGMVLHCGFKWHGCFFMFYTLIRSNTTFCTIEFTDFLFILYFFFATFWWVNGSHFVVKCLPSISRSISYLNIHAH